MSKAKSKKNNSAEKQKPRSLFSRIRKHIIYSTIMMTIGGSAEKYHEHIFDFLQHKAKPAIEQIIDYTKNTIHNLSD